MAHTFPPGVRNGNAGVSRRDIAVFDPQAWQSRLRRDTWQVYECSDVLRAEGCVNNLRAECDVTNEAKIFRIEIVFATLKPAVKIETVECNLH